VRRRDFITSFAWFATAWPLTARAQQPELMQRIGVLNSVAADDPQGQASMAAFRQGLQRHGWIESRNVRLDVRWGGSNPALLRKYAAELVGLAPGVIEAVGPDALAAMVETTRTVPIVFAIVPDPVGAGFVDSLAQPGGNVTGFMIFEYSLAAKWPELLKEMSPTMTRVAVLRDPAITAGTGQFAVIQSVAPSLGLDLRPIDVRDPGTIERAVANFARAANGGLIVTGAASTVVYRDRIIKLAAQYKLPAIYYERFFAAGGGLISYGPTVVDECSRAADYVDRILKGEKPADLPVQAPTKYDLVINLKTAKTLGLAVPASLLARADEVIE
jgi:putative tryptophan/tyrosine transport system substrate-binding protein